MSTNYRVKDIITNKAILAQVINDADLSTLTINISMKSPTYNKRDDHCRKY